MQAGYGEVAGRMRQAAGRVRRVAGRVVRVAGRISRLYLGEVLISLLEVPRHRVLLHLRQRVGSARLEVLEHRLDLGLGVGVRVRVRVGVGVGVRVRVRVGVGVGVRVAVRGSGLGLLHPGVVELLAHGHLPRRRYTTLARRARCSDVQPWLGLGSGLGLGFRVSVRVSVTVLRDEP